ncbi:MAG: Electron transport protein SCO1/SenC [Pedosphaera sp.]|nr:Electron transport protein SCO1/SenC [Pedosphaera sp.]
MVALLALAVSSCSRKSEEPMREIQTTDTSTNQQIFQVKGEIKEIKPDGKTAVIKHEEVPNFMPAMTMPLEVKNTNELRGLKAGDVVSFRMIVTDSDAWIDQVQKLNEPRKLSELPSKSSALRVVRDVDPLKVGHPLPNYHFTNELGQAVSTSQFKGQALAFTFFFIKCPYPTFCPLMSGNFAEAQNKLLAMPNAPTNWHLMSITFDPESDTPAALKAYAEKYKYNPKHWNFVTGDLVEITAIADQFGETFGNEGGTIVHNLRTVVVDAQGRVQKIIPENKWTSDELVAEIIKAAQAKP